MQAHTTPARQDLRSALNRRFARHYVEMVLVMLVGMAVLAMPARWVSEVILPGTDVDDPTLMLGRMGVIMAVPMVAWMAWRGHAWRPCAEMAAAMIVPAIGAIALLQLEVLESTGMLMALEHVAMFAAMFLVMLARPTEYAHAH